MSQAHNPTIYALSTPPGAGAIAVIRISGPSAVEVCDRLLHIPSGKKLKDCLTHTAHFGRIMQGPKVVDEVVATLFLGPKSFTGEDTVEISCHGSVYIQQQIMQLLSSAGARMAKPGEFTLRAFLNKKMDLTQAEAVADLIASSSEAEHRIAMDQMRGGFSSELKNLREQLMNFASLIELELDFSEEDVEFANRDQLHLLIDRIHTVASGLRDSFHLGNVIKTGIPVAIIGEPNAGKSTLLNALLNEERAIVSDIAGTTRDVIEDVLVMGGLTFRFIDTAGIRETKDTIENLGIQKALEKAEQARLILYLVDAAGSSPAGIEAYYHKLKEIATRNNARLLVVFNKTDLATPNGFSFLKDAETLNISARERSGIEELKSRLLKSFEALDPSGKGVVISNVRHYEALGNLCGALENVNNGLRNGIPGDLVAIDIRQALHFLGEITGQITTDDLLGNIFSKFCIGK